jgi:hypothetical protein
MQTKIEKQSDAVLPSEDDARTAAPGVVQLLVFLFSLFVVLYSVDTIFITSHLIIEPLPNSYIWFQLSKPYLLTAALVGFLLLLEDDVALSVFLGTAIGIALSALIWF